MADAQGITKSLRTPQEERLGRSPSFGSLFSGIGGLDLGLERAGWECRWQVEIDEWCRAVLARHWPDVPRWDDAKTFLMADSQGSGGGMEGREPPGAGRRTTEGGRAGLRQEYGDTPNLGTGTGCEVDLICGGFPCQPVSVAGKRRGQDDERWLWPEFARIVRLLRPRYVLVENVPGLLARGMGDVLGDLAASGYDTEWDCIPAAAVGAPHLRYRVFIVAHANGYGQGRSAPLGQAGVPRLCQEQAGAEPDGTGARAAAHPDGRGREGERGSGLLDGQRPALWDDADGRRGAVAHADRERRPRRSGVFGQGWRPEPSDGGWWTTEPDVGRVAHGVPSRVDRLRGLGNAVVPQVAEWIGRRLMEMDA